MIDHKIRPLMDPLLTRIGLMFSKLTISANAMTGIGFVFGCLTLLCILMDQAPLGGVFFILNRICDGLDGGIARNQGLTDFGGYLDIISDFIIYPAIPLAFAITNPHQALAAAFVIFAMAGAMTSFLAFAILCAKNDMETTKRGQKSFYYLGGLCEGFETAVFLGAMCFFPGYFSLLAWIFGVLCCLTTLGRILNTKRIFSKP